MSESIEETPHEVDDPGLAAEWGEAKEAREQERTKKAAHDHDDEKVDEWEEESFPASDPPSNY